MHNPNLSQPTLKDLQVAAHTAVQNLNQGTWIHPSRMQGSFVVNALPSSGGASSYPQSQEIVMNLFGAPSGGLRNAQLFNAPMPSLPQSQFVRPLCCHTFVLNFHQSTSFLVSLLYRDIPYPLSVVPKNGLFLRRAPLGMTCFVVSRRLGSNLLPIVIALNLMDPLSLPPKLFVRPGLA